MSDSRGGFGHSLRAWRERRGVSQIDLGLIAAVSSRHISFLENSRARPSRRMVLRLAEALDLSLRDRNGMLLAAEFAPAYSERAFDAEELAGARQALGFLLEAHSPNPAIVLDRQWDLVLWNRPHEVFAGKMLPPGTDLYHLNGLDLVFEPGLLRDRIVNWPQVAAAVLRRLRRQVLRWPGDVPLRERWEKVLAAPGVVDLGEVAWEREELLLPMVLQYGDLRLSLFNTLSTFGAPGDATLEELVLETFFPADPETRAIVQQLASTD